MSVCVPHRRGPEEGGKGWQCTGRECNMTKSRGNEKEDMSGPDQEKTGYARMTG
jgi:hypothetical protein